MPCRGISAAAAILFLLLFCICSASVARLAMPLFEAILSARHEK
jgi:hypothetical protein